MLKNILGKEVLFFDGGTGTVLQEMGLKAGELPENWNITKPENIIDLNFQYFCAGSNIVNTNTFGAFITKFPLNLEKVITSAIDNANAAREKFYRECWKGEGCNMGRADSLVSSGSGNVWRAKPAVGDDGNAGRTDFINGGSCDAGVRCNTGASCNAERERTDCVENVSFNAGSEDYKVNNPAKKFIAFDIGSCGKLLKPMGDLDFEDCISLYKKSFRIAFKCRIDCVMIETMNDGYETKAAVLAAKETMQELGVSFPIIVSNVYDQQCRTLSGSTPETMIAMLEGLRVDVIGVNCSLGPEQMKPVVKRLCKAASVPVLVKPNAGLPKVVDGKTVFDVKADDFVKTMVELSEFGPAVLGGCCGTTPEYIKKLVSHADCFNKALAEQKPANSSCGYVSSNTQIVYFGADNPPVLIGERINPTGKKKFKEALRNNDIAYIIHQGLEQEKAGAQVLDVNVGLPEIDEKQMMLSVMTELQSVTNLPLQIDTTEPKVMEAALRRYNGKPMVNSVNGKQQVMDEIFPLVQKYGGLVVALTLDEDGIPETSQKRMEIAQKIYAEAEKYGISKKDIIIDPLAMAVSSDSKAAIATLETVKEIHKMGGLTSLGISNVSFGLPNREFVTSSFFTMSMTNGLSAAIMNPLQTEMIKAYKCFCLLHGMDDNCTDYISWAQDYETMEMQKTKQNTIVNQAANSLSQAQSDASNQKNDKTQSEGKSPLAEAIIHGLKEDAAQITKEMLKTMDSLEIINKHLIVGLDFVGKKFEEKTMYLPQLLMAAEAAKSAFGEIRDYMEKNGKKGKSKGRIVIATVKGDIHDIGKNIVKVLLENYDFEVIDLGKDVPPEKIVQVCKEQNIKLAGLSALMTTTVASMEETIKLLRRECPQTKVCVGGAVMTQEYADKIGADFYGKDAMDTVRYALKLFEQ